MFRLLAESIEVHNTLNPKIWNGDILKEEVQQKLLEIYSEFIKHIDIPLNVVDVEIVGSNASFNYNEKSDIDLHIIVNSEVTYMEPTLLQQFYNSKKSSFNDKYDLSIYGIPIELYIEDIKSSNATNGRYSILTQNWVLVPEPIEYKIPNIDNELINMEEKCSEMLLSEDSESILDFINEIYMMRKLGLEQGGEASVGNLVFKELRNMDLISDLRDRYFELKSKELSI